MTEPLHALLSSIPAPFPSPRPPLSSLPHPCLPLFFSLQFKANKLSVQALESAGSHPQTVQQPETGAACLLGHRHSALYGELSTASPRWGNASRKSLLLSSHCGGVRSRHPPAEGQHRSEGGGGAVPDAVDSPRVFTLLHLLLCLHEWTCSCREVVFQDVLHSKPFQQYFNSCYIRKHALKKENCFLTPERGRQEKHILMTNL